MDGRPGDFLQCNHRGIISRSADGWPQHCGRVEKPVAAVADSLYPAALDRGIFLYRQKPGYGVPDIFSCHQRQNIARYKALARQLIPYSSYLVGGSSQLIGGIGWRLKEKG